MFDKGEKAFCLTLQILGDTTVPELFRIFLIIIIFLDSLFYIESYFI